LVAKYDVPVLALSVATLSEQDILDVFREVLYEFPVNEVNVNLPSWVMVLQEDHWLRTNYESAIRETIEDIQRLRDVDRVVQKFYDYPFIAKAVLSDINMGQGVADIDLYAPDELYDQVLTEIVGVEIQGKIICCN